MLPRERRAVASTLQAFRKLTEKVSTDLTGRGSNRLTGVVVSSHVAKRNRGGGKFTVDLIDGTGRSFENVHGFKLVDLLGVALILERLNF